VAVGAAANVVVIVLRADAGRYEAAQPILVGSASCRVAIQRRPGREHGRVRGVAAVTTYR
jgi:hypothetical protein